MEKHDGLSPGLIHLLNDDKGLVYVVVLEKDVFDRIPFPLHEGEVLSRPVMLPDGRGIIFQYVESGGEGAQKVD